MLRRILILTSEKSPNIAVKIDTREFYLTSEELSNKIKTRIVQVQIEVLRKRF